MKKPIKIKIFALCMSLSLLFSCGGGLRLPKLSPSDPVDLTVWHYYNGQQKTAFDAQIAKFNETVGTKKGIVVQAFGQGNVSDLTSKVMDAAQKKVGAGDIPNIFAAYTDTAYAVDKLGLVAELDKYITSDELDAYRSEYIAEGRFDASGSLKIFPVAKSVELMAVNKTDWDKFASATNADVNSLATIEGVTQTAEQYYNWTDSLTEQPHDGKAFFGRDAMANYMLIGAKQLGVELFEVNGETVTYNLDKNVIRKLWDNYYIPFVKGYFAANNRFRSDDIKTGTIIALVGSSSGTTYFPDKVNTSDTSSYPIESMVLQAPIFNNSKPYAVQQGAGMVVTKSDARTEYAATVFLKWITDEERNIEFAAQSSYMPVKNSACDKAKIAAALGDMPKLTSEVFDKSLSTIGSYTLYTGKPFNGGVKARAILDKSMSDAASADRAAILSAIEGGAEYEAALAPYITDARFDSFYSELGTALNKVK